MGRRHRLSSNPALASEHASGTTAHAILLLEHERLGTIGYVLRRPWVFHYNAACCARDDLAQLHDEVLQLPVSKEGIRLLGASNEPISEPDLAERMYDTGVRMVLNVVLATQHVCNEIEHCTRQPFLQSTIEDRVAHASKIINWHDPKNDPGWSAFTEICKCRNAVEHPKEANTFGNEPDEWDQVPLSWFLCERPLVTFDAWENWFHALVDAWEAKRASMPAQPMTMEVRRGIRSDRQFKKPPKDVG